jgi:putrescine transport system substrate-binding protein
MLFAHPAIAQTQVLHLFAYADEFDLSVLDDFTKETGIPVTYDAYQSDEAVQARLDARKSGFDVVVVAGSLLPKQIAAGNLQRLDKTKLPEIKTLWPEIMARLATFDPGNSYGVTYLWFTLGLTYNDALFKQRLKEMPAVASVAPNLSWDMIFRPEMASKFSDCGIEVEDSPNELFALALHQLRLDPRSRSILDLRRAAELLYALRRNVKRFRALGDVSALASGDACLSLGASSDAVQAGQQARDAGEDVQIGFAVPKGGTLVLLDTLAIPVDAPNPEAAYLFIRYLMRPEIAARNTLATHVANSVPASKAFLPQEIVANPSIYPDDATIKALFTMGSYDATEQAFINREWMRIKTGK